MRPYSKLEGSDRISCISKITKQDMRQMQDMAKDRFDRIMIILRSMPTSMLLVFR